jgi:hypothetical protein
MPWFQIFSVQLSESIEWASHAISLVTLYEDIDSIDQIKRAKKRLTDYDSENWADITRGCYVVPLRGPCGEHALAIALWGLTTNKCAANRCSDNSHYTSRF